MVRYKLRKGRHGKMKKKKIGVILLIIILAAGAGTAVWYFKFRDAGQSVDSENTVFVDSVGMITGISTGMTKA